MSAPASPTHPSLFSNTTGSPFHPTPAPVVSPSHPPPPYLGSDALLVLQAMSRDLPLPSASYDDAIARIAELQQQFDRCLTRP